VANVLIIDDDRIICDAISNVVKDIGHSVICVNTLKDGLKKSISEDIDVVFLDVKMPDGNGLEIMPNLQEAPSSPEIIIITGFGDPDGAELAIKNGAWDYIEKPSTIQKITLALVRALQYRKEIKDRKPSVAIKREGIVGNSPQLRACLNIIAQAAKSDANVLISGETGTGKELFALAIHTNSSRANKNFVVVDCASLPKTLVESMLFGHEKGAFTGADRAHDGLIKQADGGTLFLDEVGELLPSVQKSFLRVLQGRRFRRIGGDREIESDFRLIVASNRDLDDLVRHKQFREDLLFRLRTFTIELPPLRERLEDIEELARYYVAQLGEEYGTGVKEFSPEFFDILVQYPWPGNVRELIHALERAFAAAEEDPVLFPKHLPPHLRAKMVRASVSKKATDDKESARITTSRSEVLPSLQKAREAALSEMEQQYLRDLISYTGGHIKKACHISGLSRSRLYTLLKKYHISTVG
jgi:two-component system NtrC family response regulator